MTDLIERNAVSKGMSIAYKARSRACPVCGRKTIQPASGSPWWIPRPFVCRWRKYHEEKQ